MKHNMSIEERGNPREFLSKQWKTVRPGYHILTRIFPPKDYPNATLCTAEFRLSVKPDEWEILRLELLDCYQKGLAADIYVNGKEVQINCPSEHFDCAWTRDAHGAVIVYEPERILYVPTWNKQEPQELHSGDIPF